MLDTRNILVPTDFSASADKALELAVDIAKRSKADIHLLHVIEPVQQCVADYCLADEVIRGIKERNKSETLVNFRKETVRFKQEGVEIVQDIREGAPYDEILKEQEENDMDIIVMSSHERAGLKKYFGRSLAHRVMRASPCNVILLKS